MHHNKIVNSQTGILIGGGRSNLVTNNYFYNISHVSVYFDDRGETYDWFRCEPNGTFEKELEVRD